MKKLLPFLVINITINFFQPVFGQSIVPKFIRRMYFEKDTVKHSSFVVLPVLSSAPETGIEVGGAGLYSFYSDTVHRETRVSNVFAYATLTTKGQNRLSISTNYWTPQNKLHYTASLGFIHFPFDFYGLGNNTRAANADLVDEKRYKLTFQAEKLLGNSIYVGFVAGALKYNYGDNNITGIFNTDPQIEDRSGGISLYAGPCFDYDTRNNNTYTTRGMIITAYFNAMQGVLGNNGYRGGFFNLEYSQFFALNKQLVLAFDIQEQSLTGGQSPFYLLPEMGSDEMMRGYYEGRYRDRNFIAGQTELRYRIDERFGIVGFVGTGEVFHTSFSAPQLKPDYGGGVRYFFDIEKGLSIRADYGIGEKPAGNREKAVFMLGWGKRFDTIKDLMISRIFGLINKLLIQ